MCLLVMQAVAQTRLEGAEVRVQKANVRYQDAKQQKKQQRLSEKELQSQLKSFVGLTQQQQEARLTSFEDQQSIVTADRAAGFLDSSDFRNLKVTVADVRVDSLRRMEKVGIITIHTRHHSSAPSSLYVRGVCC